MILAAKSVLPTFARFGWSGTMSKPRRVSLSTMRQRRCGGISDDPIPHCKKTHRRNGNPCMNQWFEHTLWTKDCTFQTLALCNIQVPVPHPSSRLPRGSLGQIEDHSKRAYTLAGGSSRTCHVKLWHISWPVIVSQTSLEIFQRDEKERGGIHTDQ